MLLAKGETSDLFGVNGDVLAGFEIDSADLLHPKALRATNNHVYIMQKKIPTERQPGTNSHLVKTLLVGRAGTPKGIRGAHSGTTPDSPLLEKQAPL